MSTSYRDLRVWQQGMRLAVNVYGATKKFPRTEQFGLISQMNRSAVSVPSNIAEGKGRQTMKEFRSFLFHARGSLLELETQIQLAEELKFLDAKESESLQKQCSELGSGLAGLINHLNAKTAGAGS